MTNKDVSTCCILLDSFILGRQPDSGIDGEQITMLGS